MLSFASERPLFASSESLQRLKRGLVEAGRTHSGPCEGQFASGELPPARCQEPPKTTGPLGHCSFKVMAGCSLFTTCTARPSAACSFSSRAGSGSLRISSCNVQPVGEVVDGCGVSFDQTMKKGASGISVASPKVCQFRVAPAGVTREPGAAGVSAKPAFS